MANMAIEIAQVNKSFGRTHVLQGVSLSVREGTTFAFLGRNGAGKTTMIRTLLGLIPRDSGEVRVLGLDPATDPIDLRAEVGYLAEDQTMYGWMRIDEILSFVAPFYPTWDHELAGRYVFDFDLPPRAKIKTLSKGQKVRLGLVLALAHRPQLVILDDPALGLDPIMRKQFNRDLITHLQGEGRTVFYSSHLLYEVEPVADEVAILDHGRVVRQAETESLRRQVKQIVLSRPAFEAVQEKLVVLAKREEKGEMLVAVDRAEGAIDALERDGVEHRVMDLNLDEIFEAFVGDHSARDSTVAVTQRVAGAAETVVTS
jgi:ABC-2 type transport system ATP-binding protein